MATKLWNPAQEIAANKRIDATENLSGVVQDFRNATRPTNAARALVVKALNTYAAASDAALALEAQVQRYERQVADAVAAVRRSRRHARKPDDSNPCEALPKLRVAGSNPVSRSKKPQSQTQSESGTPGV